MLRFAYTTPNNTVCIVYAAPPEALVPVLGPLSDEAYRAHVLDRSIPSDATNLVELGLDWVPPSDRAFRSAWAVNGKSVIVDMQKAREIHKDRLRVIRAPMLAALDVEYQRADESGNDEAKADVRQRKQTLRDLTSDPAINRAADVVSLIATVPAALRAAYMSVKP